MPHVTINGVTVECPAGSSLLAAARSAGAAVPGLCDDPRLRPIGACRLCLVEVKGWPRPVTACNTMAVDAMEVRTHTPAIEQARRTILRMLAQQYPSAAVSRFPDKRFHRLLRAYGLETEARGKPDAALVDDSHPYIRVDMSQCVLCFRCVRICDEVQGQLIWQAWGRGEATQIRPNGASLMDSPCVSCGACADTCPTGAIEDRETFLKGCHTQWTRTVCPYCGVGCEVNVGTLGRQIVSVRPVLDAPVNKGHLCVKGRYAYAFNHAPDRVTQPMLRENGRWKTASWDAAIAFAADALRRVIDRYGPDAVGVLGSARATNEENYLAQKFARVVIGTNNVDCCARVCHAPTAAGMKMVLGTGAATNSFDDIEHAAAILVCGANATENHPVIGARIKEAAPKGAALIVIDPRRIELARHADCHLALRPGTNVPLLNAIACAIIEEELCDPDFVRDRVAGWDEFCRFIRAYRPEAVSGICRVDSALIRKAARIYATRRPAMSFHGLGVTEHVQGTEGVMCLVNLALLTGNLGKPGAGINPLRGQNNVQGAAHMGCDPGSLTGMAPLEEGRDLVERVWGAPLPKCRGLNLMRMIDAANEGRLKALWAIGYDIALTNPNAALTSRALSGLDLLIVQDLFKGKIAEFAHVFLPAASSFEKDGTFMNAERRVQRIRAALPPAGASRPDWRIICDLAASMGAGRHFDFHSPQQIWDEIRAVWPAGRGITYERLEDGGLQWPCPTEDHPGTAILHAGSFRCGPRAELRRVAYSATDEMPSEEFPLLLNTGRTLYHFNAGTMTLRTANFLLRGGDFVDVSPADASSFSIRDGQEVRLVSRYGTAALPARINPDVKPGELFATFHTARSFLNQVTSAHRDRYTHTPEYKLTAVRLEPLTPNP